MPRLPARGYAAQSATTPLAPFAFERRAPGPRDVHIEIQFCGVCHSDLHQVRNEWGGSTFPMVPGHEILGRVKAVGAEVTRFTAGQRVAVGCMVDACRACRSCREGEEQYCDGPLTFTYNSPDRVLGGSTQGGYSDHVVVDQDFVLSVAEHLEPAGAAPLLCAGITTWSPLRTWGVGPGQRVGVVGLGGLGHMGVKLAHALGARVSLFTTSAGKAADARRLGADEVILTREPDALARHAGRFDFLLDTVAAPHNLDAYLSLLKRDGTLCLVGVPDRPHPAPGVFPLVMRRRRLAGSLIGGIRETQELLDFCADRNIVSDVEVIPIQQINAAYERMLRSDVKYRFVIDLASLKG
ncbi:MAG: NAD(P)-dependent alcohol dehydrogenase [Gemmatimonadales bacterium]|nr:NAD(P)-dependent alcohol dehydrogenase [Gemmatimonadales bacterium]